MSVHLIVQLQLCLPFQLSPASKALISPSLISTSIVSLRLNTVIILPQVYSFISCWQSRPGRSWRQWCPSCACKALHVLFVALPLMFAFAAALLNNTTSGRRHWAAALQQPQGWLQIPMSHWQSWIKRKLCLDCACLAAAPGAVAAFRLGSESESTRQYQ